MHLGVGSSLEAICIRWRGWGGVGGRALKAPLHTWELSLVVDNPFDILGWIGFFWGFNSVSLLCRSVSIGSGRLCVLLSSVLWENICGPKGVDNGYWPRGVSSTCLCFAGQRPWFQCFYLALRSAVCLVQCWSTSPHPYPPRMCNKHSEEHLCPGGFYTQNTFIQIVRNQAHISSQISLDLRQVQIISFLEAYFYHRDPWGLSL